MDYKGKKLWGQTEQRNILVSSTFQLNGIVKENTETISKSYTNFIILNYNITVIHNYINNVYYKYINKIINTDFLLQLLFQYLHGDICLLK